MFLFILKGAVTIFAQAHVPGNDSNSCIRFGGVVCGCGFIAGLGSCSRYWIMGGLRQLGPHVIGAFGVWFQRLTR